jgi:Protein of unknown function (DUF2917)
MNPCRVHDLRVAVQKGTLWATRRGDPEDHLIGPGETRDLKGRWILEPLQITGPCVFQQAPLYPKKSRHTRFKRDSRSEVAPPHSALQPAFSEAKLLQEPGAKATDGVEQTRRRRSGFWLD